MIHTMNPTGHLLLVRVREPETGECIGSGLFLGFNGTMYSWRAAAFRGKQHHQPNESLHWFAMRYWRDRGMKNHNMVGGGDYESWHGANYTETHWIRVSRWGVLISLRDRAQGFVRTVQEIRGKYFKRRNEI